jgi:hypothetical protein
MELYEEINSLGDKLASSDIAADEAIKEIDTLIEKTRRSRSVHAAKTIAVLHSSKAFLAEGSLLAARERLGAASRLLSGGAG